MATTPKGKGANVVKEVVDTINSLGIFANDHKFLCRVAWVESKYGEAPGTYRSGYHGGIWQVELFRQFSICTSYNNTSLFVVFISTRLFIKSVTKSQSDQK